MHSGREQTVRDSRSYVAYWVIKCSLAFAVQTQWCLPWFISKSILPFSSVFMLTSQRADHAEPQHQMMINIATDTHLCIYLISMSVDSFWLITFTDIIFFFFPSVTGGESVCSHGNSSLNISPSRWSDDESFHHPDTDTPMFTSGKRHTTRLK